MANKYKYMFFDAQIVLTTGMHALSNPRVNNGIVKKEELIKMFIQSVFKVVREVGCDRPFLLWDSSPYHKSTILKEKLGIEDYKGDRGYQTQDDLDSVDAKIKELETSGDYTPEEMSELKKKYFDILRQVTNFKIRTEVKYLLMSEFDQFGFTSISKKGYEADDIAALLSRYLKNDPNRHLFITKDSDWDYLLQPNIDRYNNFGRGERFKTYQQVMEFYHWLPTDFPEWSLYDLKTEIDCLMGSHNNLKNTLTKGWGNKPIREILDNFEESVQNKEVYYAQKATCDFSIYPDYEFIKECLPWYSKKGGLSTANIFQEWCDKHKIGLRSWAYKTIVNILDYELYP